MGPELIARGRVHDGRFVSGMKEGGYQEVRGVHKTRREPRGNVRGPENSVTRGGGGGRKEGGFSS